MVRRIGNIDGVKLYDVIRSEENIRIAVYEACKDHHRDPVVRAIKENPEPYISAIKEILDNESYHPSRYKFKTIYERGKKRRLCYTNTFPDRMIQHAVFNVVAPILHSTIISTEFAGMKGRGLHSGAQRVARDLKRDRRGTRYCMKIDVYHYFPNIDRTILFEMIKRKIKCYRTLEILHRIIFLCPGKNGLPIGLYSSQILSVFYLSEFDHYCKQTLVILRLYRYMDDIYIFAGSKQILWSYMEYIRGDLKKYNLKIKGNYAVFPVEKRRVDFMGYVSNHQTTMIRKRTKNSYITSNNVIIRKLRHGERIDLHDMASRRSYEGMIDKWTTENDLIKKYGGTTDIALEYGVEAVYDYKNRSIKYGAACLS